MARYTAIYRYAIKDFNDDSLIYLAVRCFIIGETEKSYRIKLQEAIPRHRPDDELWVKKSSIAERGYYDIDSGVCLLCGIKVSAQSCLACLKNCLTKKILRRKRDDEKR